MSYISNHWFTDAGAMSPVRAALQDVINKPTQISTLTKGMTSDSCNFGIHTSSF
jgi:hypothetical protein